MILNLLAAALLALSPADTGRVVESDDVAAVLDQFDATAPQLFCVTKSHVEDEDIVIESIAPAERRLNDAAPICGNRPILLQSFEPNPPVARLFMDGRLWFAVQYGQREFNLFLRPGSWRSS